MAHSPLPSSSTFSRKLTLTTLFKLQPIPSSLSLSPYSSIFPFFHSTLPPPNIFHNLFVLYIVYCLSPQLGCKFHEGDNPCLFYRLMYPRCLAQRKHPMLIVGATMNEQSVEISESESQSVWDGVLGLVSWGLHLMNGVCMDSDW